jgi:hypothetical protein
MARVFMGGFSPSYWPGDNIAMNYVRFVPLTYMLFGGAMRRRRRRGAGLW